MRVGWMENIFYVCLFFFDINSPTQDAFTQGEAHFDALMLGKQESAQSWDQKSDSYRVQHSNASFMSLLTQSCLRDVCTLSQRPREVSSKKCENIETPSMTQGFWARATKTNHHQWKHVDISEFGLKH